MPFPTNHLGVHKAIENAGRILKETRCQAVKLEGGADQADVIAGLVAAGIPVMAHVGLRPQSVHHDGRLQSAARRRAAAAPTPGRPRGRRLRHRARNASRRRSPPKITAALDIPTIGIGAGPDCDGQVLVMHDLLGLTSGYVPKFVKQYANVKEIIKKAASEYIADVAGQFPSADQDVRVAHAVASNCSAVSSDLPTWAADCSRSITASPVA